MTVTSKKGLDEYVQEYRLASGDDQEKQRKLIMGKILDELDYVIRYHVKKYPHHIREDLHQDACEAIIRCVDRFDDSKGSFQTFASHTVSNWLKDRSREYLTPFTVPKTLAADVRMIEKYEDCMKESGSSASVQDIMDAAGIRDEKRIHNARYAQVAIRNIASLDAEISINEEGAFCLYDTVAIAHEDVCIADRYEYIMQELRSAVNRLPAREKAVYSMRSGLDGVPATNGEICEKLAISEPTCISSWKKALIKIRKDMKDWNPAI